MSEEQLRLMENIGEMIIHLAEHIGCETENFQHHRECFHKSVRKCEEEIEENAR